MKAFKRVKKSYLNREEKPNLVGFFEKNTDNLEGVFESMNDQLFEEREGQSDQTIDDSLPIHRFWVNNATISYLAMFEKLLTTSPSARKAFYGFLTDKN